MSRLVLVVPLKEGAHTRAREILAEGPPFALEETGFERHEVYLTEREVVFVFASAGPSATLQVSAEDPEVWKAAAAWRECMAARRERRRSPIRGSDRDPLS